MATPIRPNEKDKMQNGVEYACLYFNRGNDESFRIEFYDKKSHRKTDLLRGLSHAQVLKQMEAQGWQQTYGTGDGEGVMNYFQRPFSRANDPNWLPSIPQSAPKPITPHPTPQPVVDRRHEYVQRPKWTKDRTGELEDGVEYMEIVFYRNLNGEGQPSEIITYGKGMQRTSQKRHMDIHDHDLYLENLKKEGWCEVHSTGNSEGSLTYLERQRIIQEENPMTNYIDVKNRHLCDPSTEYCVLNLDLDGTPYSGYVMFYHRTQKIVTQLELTDRGESIRQKLAQEGWNVVHRHMVRGGIYQVIYYERPFSPNNAPIWMPNLSPKPISQPPTQSDKTSADNPKKAEEHILYEWHTLMIGGGRRILQMEANSLFTEIIENGQNNRQMGNIQTILAQAIADGWTHLGTHIGNTKTAHILGKNGQVIASEHITPDHHTQLPNKIRITRIEDLGGELKVSAYDNQKVDNLRNQKKSLDEFVATMTKNGDWHLVYEAQEAGNRVLYLGRVMP